MDSLRDTVADTLKENEMEDSRVFVYSGAFLNYEQFKAVRNEFVLNVSLAMLMVVVIVFILLGNLIASSITSGMLILVIGECFCLMFPVQYHLGYAHSRDR